MNNQEFLAKASSNLRAQDNEIGDLSTLSLSAECAREGKVKKGDRVEKSCADFTQNVTHKYSRTTSANNQT